MAWALLGAVFVSGCEGRSCNLAGCVGPATVVSLVNEQGDPVRAQGETRVSGLKYEGSAGPFDCRYDSPDCKNGVLSVSAPYDSDGVLELRFRLPDGELTEWQSFDLDVTSRTDPDFNGPGCPCTSYEAAPLTVPVPPAAQSD
jgi:hypothetical protein